MDAHPRTRDRRKRLMLVLGVLLLTGFVTTSLVSYFVATTALRKHIATRSPPLSGDTLYSEIQRDLLRPVFISQMMARNAFLRDWMLDGERDVEPIRRYLAEVKAEYGLFSTFLVSERTRLYYYAKGVLKTVREDEERDAWYFRVRVMEAPFETNVDPDMANEDATTVFVNYRILDDEGRYLGATGVGMTIDSMAELMAAYGEKYQRGVYFVDRAGAIVLRSDRAPQGVGRLADVPGMKAHVNGILAGTASTLLVERDGESIHVNTRLVPALGWHLVVEQSEEPLIRSSREALVLNLALCLLITALVVLVTFLGLRGYQRRVDRMFEEEQALRRTSEEQRALIARNLEEIRSSQMEVKRLSGLLPMCASCKKIRDDQGYWQQVEQYIHDHSEAKFSHGLCPDCIGELYPDIDAEE